MRRRQALQLAAVAAAVGALPGRGDAQPSPVRPRVAGDDVSAAWIATYRRAVDAMLKLPPTDGRNWYRQAMIHLIDCPHANWWFLAWHRAYIGHFEGICRELTGVEDFRIPYWDWTAVPRLPAAFSQPGLDPAGAGFIQSPAALQTGSRQAVRAMFTSFTPRQRTELQRRGIASADQFLARVC
jgi:hypothetical protein